MSVRNICSVLQIWRWANFYVKIRYKYGMNVKRMAGSYCYSNTVCFLPAALTLQTNCHAVETASVPVESVFAKRWVNRITILKCWFEKKNCFRLGWREKVGLKYYGYNQACFRWRRNCFLFRSKEKGFMGTCASAMISHVLKIKANYVEVWFFYSKQN